MQRRFVIFISLFVATALICGTYIHATAKPYQAQLSNLELNNNTVEENQPEASRVGNITVQGSADFSLADDSSPFSIDNNQLITNQPLNYEAQDSYTITIIAINRNDPEDSISENFTITVLDLNDAPQITGQSNLSTPYEEPITINLEDLDVEDEDAGDNYPEGFTLTIEPGNNYSVTDNTITPDAGFSGTLNIPLYVNDGESNSNTFDITLTVEEPEEPENQTPVADAGNTQTSYTDDDRDGIETVRLDGTLSEDDGTIETYAWSWEGGSATGEIVEVEFEIGTYEITLTVTDDDDATDTDQVNITVEAPAAEAPTAITLDPADPVIEENQGSVTVGTLSANGTAPITFSLPQGEANNDLFTINGNELATTGPLDFETTTSLSVLVNAANSAGNTSQDFPVSVTNVEEPPTNIELSATTVADGSASGTIVGTLSATGGSATEVTFSLPQGEADNDSFTIQNGNELTTAQIFNFAEQATYEVVVQASGDGTYQETFTVTVTAPDNTAPIASDVTGITTQQATAVTITLTATDAEENPLIYSIVAQPENGSVTAPNQDGEVTYTPDEEFFGEDTFTFRANDGTDDSNDATVSINVNARPIANAGTDQSVVDADGNETVTLDGSASNDPDGEIVSYSWTNEEDEEIATGVNPSVNLPVGVHLINLTVTDDDNETDTDEVSITIEEVENIPPVADAGSDQNLTDEDGSGDEEVELNAGNSSDEDGNIEGYVWTENGNEIATGVNPTVTLGVGVHNIILTVTDDDEDTDTDEITVTIEEAENQEPTADAGGDISVTDEDNDGEESISLDGSGSSDPDGDALTYTWFNGNTEIATGVNPTITLAVGNYTIRLEVSDGEDESSDEVSVQINEASNNRPVAQNQNVATDEDNAIAIELGATDEDGDALTYILENLPANGMLDENGELSGNEVVYTPNENFNGTDSFTFRVNDGDEDSDIATVSIQVNAINDAPVLVQSIEDIAVEENAANIQINLSDHFQDIDNNALSYNVNNSNTGLLNTSTNANILTLSFVENSSGEATITVEASDSEFSVEESFQVTVEAVESIPFFTLVNDLFEASEDFAQAVIVAVQPEDESQQVSYSIAPPSLDFATLTADNSNGIYNFASLPDRNGEQNFTITADNGQGDTHQESFTFRVLAVNDAPVFTLSQNELTAEAGSGQQTFSAFATNIAAGPQTATDESGQSLAFTLAAANPTLFTEQPFINNDGNLSFTPTDDGEGETTVAVTLTDNGPGNGANQNSSNASFTIIINEAQLLAPEFTLSPSEIEVDEDFEEPQTVTVTPTDLSLVPTYSLNSETVPSFANLSINALTGTVTIRAIEDSSGQADIEIIATTLLGETYSQFFSLTVNAVNDAPSFTLNGNPASVAVNANQQVVEGFATNISDGDDQEQELEFVLQQTEGDLSFASDVSISINEQGTQGNLIYEAAADATGSATFEVYLQDDGTENNQSETQTFTITVEEAEAVEPVFSLSPEELILEEDFTNAATVSVDPETNTQVTYSLNNNVNSVNFATVSIDTNTGTVSIEPVDNASGGPAEISVTATDINDASNTSTASFTLEVTAVNDAPVVINPIDDVELEENAASFNINISNVFEDVEDNNLDITASSSNTELVQVSINGVNLNVNITPEAFGDALITLSAEDDEGESAQTSFEITVVEEADATPFFTLVQEIFEVNEDFTQPVSVAVQPEDESQQVSYSIAPPSLDFATLTANNDEGIYTFTARTDLNGEQNFTITADNGQGDTHQESFTFRVLAVNDQPVFELTQTNVTAEIAAGNLSFADFATNILPGPPTATDEQSQTLAFTATAADPTLFDGQPAISNEGTLTFTPADDNAGSTSVEITLTDNIDLPVNEQSSRTTTFSIEIVEEPTAAPEAIPGSGETDEDVSVEITLQGNDEDGDDLSFEIVSQPSNGSVTDPDAEGNVTYTPNPDFNGSDFFTFRVNDGSEDSEPASIDLTINAVNDAPVFTLTDSNREIPFGTTAQQEIPDFATGIDDGDPEVDQELTFVLTPDEDNTLTFVSGQEPSIDEEGTLSFQLADNASGVAGFIVILEDDGAQGGNNVYQSTPQGFTITVEAPVAEAPTAITLDPADPVIEENQGSVTVGTLSANGTAPVTFSLPQGEANNDLFTINGNVLATTGPLDFETTPSLSVLVNAANSAGNTSQNFPIAVTNVEEPPTDIVLSSNTVADGAAAGTGVGTLSSTGGSATEVTFSLPEGEADNGSFTIQNGNELTTTEIFNFAEQATYEVVVQASGDGTYQETFTVTVTAPENVAPVASNVTVTTDFNTAVSITLTATDADGDELTFEIVEGPENGTLGAISGNEVEYTPATDFSGEDSFTFQANDGTLTSNIATVNITVEASANQAPVADAGPDQNVPDEDDNGFQTVTLDGSASEDPDGEILSYSWTNEEDEILATEESPSVNLPLGANLITLTVTDNQGATGTDQVTITVTAPEAPAFSFDPESFSVAEDFEGTQSISIVPAENTPAASYSFEPALSSIDFAEVTFDEENLQVNVSAVENAFGAASITVTATDQNNPANEATATLNIAVTSVNDAPVVVNEIEDVNVNENADDRTIDISDVFSDVEDEALEFSASSENEGLVTVAVEGTTLTLSFGEGQSGNTTVSLTATDSEGASGETTFTVTVNPVNDSPIITGTNPVNMNEDEVYTVPFSAFNVTDPDNDYPEDFIIILRPGNNYTLQDGNTAILPAQDFFGTLTVPAIVNDGENNSNEVELTVTVQNVNDAPILALGNTAPILYNRNDPPVNIAASLSITDVDNSTLQSATISFGQESPFFYDEAEDLLEYTVTGGISGTWDAANGILTLSGEAPINSYITAITSITYVNQQADPTPNPRELNFTVNDGDQDSPTVIRYISIDGSNIPPQLSDFERQIPEDEPLSFTANDFSDNYTDDIDEFNNIIYITRLPETGTLVVGGQTLTDDDLNPNIGGYLMNFNNVSNFQYIPAADYNGTDSFGWTALDSELEPGYVGNAADVTITVLPVNDAPRIIAPSSVSVNENTDFDFSDTGDIVIDDVDNNTDVLIVSMSVQEGLLNFSNTGLLGALTFAEGDGSDDAAIEFSGTETDINAALGSLQYKTPEGFSGNDLLTISATDPQNSTGNATVSILVNQVNALPTLVNMESEPIVYNEESGSVQITNTITIEDRENDNMIAATISISENFVPGEDHLTFEPIEGITGRVIENRLILTGNATIATYETLLRSIRYVNNSETPQQSVRRINFQVTDVNNGSSNILSRFINVTRLNGPLQLTNIETDPLIYQPGDPQRVVTQSLTVTDIDNEELTMAIIRFAEDSYIPQEDVLIFDSEDFEAIWDEAEGVLTIEGNGSAQAYQDALRAVQYLNTSANPTLGSRGIIFTVFRNDISSNEVVRELLISNNLPPVVSDFSIDILKNSIYTFNEADFSNYYNDPDNFPENLTFVRLRISELPVRGQLYFNDEVITQEMLDTEGALEVNTEELGQLTYQPEEDYTGLDSLVWNAFDGEDYAAATAKLVFNITDLEVNAGDDIEACQGDPVALSVRVEGGSGTYTIAWACDQPNCGIDNATAAEVNVSPERTTTYFVNVVDENGITSNSDTIVVSTIACYGLPLDIPTAFTPNGDGPNDSWIITNIETYEDQVVEVYDRYGKRVFFSDGYLQPWDGSQNGQLLPAGTYYYFIKLNNGEQQHRGSVSILK